MPGAMTQWMKDRLARQHEEARHEGFKEGFEEGFREGQMEARLKIWMEARLKVLVTARLEDRRQLNAWARQQELAPPFPDLDNGAPTGR